MLQLLRRVGFRTCPHAGVPTASLQQLPSRRPDAPCPAARSLKNSPLGIGTIRNLLQQCLDVAGIMDAAGRPFKTTAHATRRTFIRMAIRAGSAVPTIMAMTGAQQMLPAPPSTLS